MKKQVAKIVELDADQMKNVVGGETALSLVSAKSLSPTTMCGGSLMGMVEDVLDLFQRVEAPRSAVAQ